MSALAKKAVIDLITPHSLACPHDNSLPDQDGITKFGSEVQNTLVKIPVVFVPADEVGGDIGMVNVCPSVRSCVRPSVCPSRVSEHYLEK